MITIAQLVDKIISQRPFLEEVMSEGLVNLSAMARKIQPEIEARYFQPFNNLFFVFRKNY